MVIFLLDFLRCRIAKTTGPGMGHSPFSHLRMVRSFGPGCLPTDRALVSAKIERPKSFRVDLNVSGVMMLIEQKGLIDILPSQRRLMRVS